MNEYSFLLLFAMIVVGWMLMLSAIGNLEKRIKRLEDVRPQGEQHD